MAKQKSGAGRQEKTAILYGMQRTGSNYMQQVLLQNFKHLRFFSNGFGRCLPTHKHFRLYEEKVFIPDARYYNSFSYENFSEFKAHAEQVAGQQIDLFIVCIKDPYSWYISYKKHARKNKFNYFKRALNSHYIIDYNLFYKKWFDFFMEAPAQVLVLRYEDFLSDLDGKLEEIAAGFGLERVSGKSVNPEKVPMSKRFTAKRASYYKTNKYLDLITDRERSIIQHLLDPAVFPALGYKIIKVEP